MNSKDIFSRSRAMGMGLDTVAGVREVITIIIMDATAATAAAAAATVARGIKGF